MPPEYAVHGHYSVKSDVFGFGVIVLEIVSGSKNRGFSDPEHSLNLLGHAWRLWTEDRPLELIDINLHERCIPFEVLRCIHVGLLCVQQKPGDRPDMSSVIPMLNERDFILVNHVKKFRNEILEWALSLPYWEHALH
ncbi:hypothetical protein JHK86_033882 [Glycine max]|nr:hypothetical protein JHK86_033882 [Glycine max]